MADPITYTRIHKELSGKLESARSHGLVDQLTQAVKLTESTRTTLDLMRTRTEFLIDSAGQTNPRAENIMTAAANVIANCEENIQLLQQRLENAKKFQESRKASRVSVEGGPTELRELLDRIGALDDDPLFSVERIEEEIEHNREHAKRTAELASLALQTATSSQAMLRSVFALSLLFLQHILINMIYDTSQTEFEKQIGESMRTTGISWAAGQAVGLIPLLGLPFSLWELARGLAGIRGQAWSNTDMTMLFLERYVETMSRWQEVATAKLLEIDAVLS